MNKNHCHVPVEMPLLNASACFSIVGDRIGPVQCSYGSAPRAKRLWRARRCFFPSVRSQPVSATDRHRHRCRPLIPHSQTQPPTLVDKHQAIERSFGQSKLFVWGDGLSPINQQHLQIMAPIQIPGTPKSRDRQLAPKVGETEEQTLQTNQHCIYCTFIVLVLRN